MRKAGEGGFYIIGDVTVTKWALSLLEHNFHIFNMLSNCHCQAVWRPLGLNDFLAIKNDPPEELQILVVGLTRMETCYQVFL